jgi:hypothetical protein
VARRGKELFYFAHDLTEMVAVAVTPEPTLQVGTPTLLFTGRFNTGITAQFNVTPDGRRFLIMVPLATPSSPPPG